MAQEDGKPRFSKAVNNLSSAFALCAASDEVIDIFSAAGLKKPDISILSDEFLAEVKGLEHKSLAAEVLRKLLTDEIKTASKRNVVQSRAFSEMLNKSLLAYQNRATATHWAA